MFAALHAVIPDVELLLTLQPEELAAHLLICLNNVTTNERGSFSTHNLFGDHLNIDRYADSRFPYPNHRFREIQQALMEALGVLLRDGFITSDAEQGAQGFHFFITRRGKAIRTTEEMDAYRKANLLPQTLLHPHLATRVWPHFARGEYDTAVFLAFKEVEIAVRAAGGFDATTLGLNLMREAFKENTGKLTDTSLPVSEQMSLRDLFCGAIGTYKNPGSHRQVSLADPDEAVELIFLANHLLRIVDSRTAPPASTPSTTTP